MRKNSFILNNTELFYEEMGQGTPFLLIHGWAIDHRFLMNALEPAFNKCDRPDMFRRIYVDIPGMGQSIPGDVKNGDDIIEVLFAFMEEIAPGEKFYVGGNSFGASLSRAMVAKCPEKILGAMLIVPSSKYGSNIPAIDGIYRKDEKFLKSLPIPDRAAFCIMNANLTEECYKRYKTDALPSVRDNRNNDYLKKTLKGSFSFDVEKKLEKIKYEGPVLILTARNDATVGYEKQFEWINVFSHASYMMIDGAGHNANIDQPEMFTYIVVGWLDCILKDYML